MSKSGKTCSRGIGAHSEFRTRNAFHEEGAEGGKGCEHAVTMRKGVTRHKCVVLCVVCSNEGV
jgi:hypothetical protein